MVSFNPEVQEYNNPFAASVSGVELGANSYQPQAAASEEAGYAEYTGKGVNGIHSSGVHGEVPGTGLNGEHKLNRYM